MEPEPEPQGEEPTAVQQAQQARQQRLANLAVPHAEMRGIPRAVLDVMTDVSMSPRDAARMGGVNREWRDVSTVALHNLDQNPHITRLQERYRSRLRRPFINAGPHYRMPLRQSMQLDRDLPDVTDARGRVIGRYRPSRYRRRVIDTGLLEDQLGRRIMPDDASRGR